MKKSFITGIVLLFPLVVTIAILVVIVDFFTGPFVDMVKKILEASHIPLTSHVSKEIIHFGAQLLVLICLFFSIVILGILIRHFFFNILLRLADEIFGRIPFVNKIYKAMQEIAKTLMGSKKTAFKQVVMVPFPTDDVYAIGLVTGTGISSNQTGTEPLLKEPVSVFVPTTPNPTSGYIVLFDKSQVIYLDMKVEDAVKYIVSCGVVTSETEKK